MDLTRRLNTVAHVVTYLVAVISLVPPVVASASTPQEDLVSSLRKGDLEGVRTAIKNGARVNAVYRPPLVLFGKPVYTRQGYAGQREIGWTPLFWPAYEGHLNIAEYLIAQGATVDVKDDSGATPIMFAIWQNRTEMVQPLLKHGAKTSEEKYGMTLLMLAAAGPEADVKCMKALLYNGISVDAKDAQGWTALHHATRSSEKAKFLLNNGADLSQTTTDGLTPLILAAKISQLDVIKAFLSHKPNVNAQDKLGLSALGHAVRTGNCEAVKMLLDAGADLNLKTNEGKSVEDLANEALESEKRNALKVKTVSESVVLVTDGFIYQKGVRQGTPPNLSVSEASGGVLKAKGTFMLGSGGFGLVASGETLITLEGEPSHSCVGATWVFEQPNISFRNGSYVYTSKDAGARIEFGDDGVLLMGFTWVHEKLEGYQNVLALLRASSKK